MNFEFNRSFFIRNREIGEHQPVFIIAEAGVAHFGLIEKAKQLVDLAADAGADAVKFQIFKTEELISLDSNEWKKRLQSKELPHEAFRDIQEYCEEKGIIFLATSHDEQSFEFLSSLDVPAYKIGSGEVNNWSFIERVAAEKKPLILSTGMYTLEEIGNALEIISRTGNTDIAVLHCVTNYPAFPSEVNLRVMDTIREKYGVIVGYSDHTRGFHFPLAAVACGAHVIEKHISLDFDVPDAQDWKVSCGPDNLYLMVKQIREIEAGLGSGIKVLSASEKANLKWARKSLVATVDIIEDEIISPDKICIKRPGNGIAPTEINEVIGKKVKVKIKKNTLIRWENLYE